MPIWTPAPQPQPTCIATRSSSQSLTTATLTLIGFNGTDTYDPYNMHDPVTNNSRIVMPQAGLYKIWFDIAWGTGSATGNRWIYIQANAAGAGNQINLVMDTVAGSVTDSPGTTGDGLFQFAAGDYIEMYGYQNSGGALSVLAPTVNSLITGTSVPCFFGASWVSSA